MSESQVQSLFKELRAISEKLDVHILNSDDLHQRTERTLDEIKPILEDLQAAKRIGGLINKFFNSKLGWAVLLALSGYIGWKL